MPGIQMGNSRKTEIQPRSDKDYGGRQNNTNESTMTSNGGTFLRSKRDTTSHDRQS
jgi:hypothetical protein